MRKFIVMAVAARWVQRCGHKRCVRREWLDRWHDYMFAVNGRERLAKHTQVLHDFYDRLNRGQVSLMDVRELELM